MLTPMKIKLLYMMPLILSLTACGVGPSTNPLDTPTPSENSLQDPVGEITDNPIPIPTPGLETEILSCIPIHIDEPGIKLELANFKPNDDHETFRGTYNVISEGRFAGDIGDVTATEGGGFIFTSGELADAHGKIISTDHVTYTLIIGNTGSHCDRQ